MEKSFKSFNKRKRMLLNEIPLLFIVESSVVIIEELIFSLSIISQDCLTYGSVANAILNLDISQEVSCTMTWKLTQKKQHAIIENEHGKTLSYHPNLGIQIIEKDGFAFKDLNANGKLDAFEDWRLPLTERVEDFKKQFGLWQEDACLYYRKGRIRIPEDVFEELICFLQMEEWKAADLEGENLDFLKENHLLVVLLLMFDNDRETGREDYLLQLIVQSVELGVLENIVYSIWEAVRNYIRCFTEKESSHGLLQYSR